MTVYKLMVHSSDSSSKNSLLWSQALYSVIGRITTWFQRNKRNTKNLFFIYREFLRWKLYTRELDFCSTLHVCANILHKRINHMLISMKYLHVWYLYKQNIKWVYSVYWLWSGRSEESSRYSHVRQVPVNTWNITDGFIVQ